jgi:formate-dependent nitrite reductase membrane component NrfD
MDAVGLPSTYFTDAPNWHWLIVFYFFIGGLAGGCYFLAVLADLFGRPEDRLVARIGYLVALPAVLVCAVLLILDLSRPDRFWHMLVESKTWRPMLKAYSPISIGSWALFLFGAFALGSFLAALRDTGRVRWSWTRLFRPPGLVGTAFALAGGFMGFFVASYTGVLLSVTNRPLWADTPLLGLVFMVSAASTSAALLVLLGYRRWAGRGGVLALRRFDAAALVVELAVLVALVVSLGSLARAWLNVWGGLLVVGVVIAGILVPLALHWRSPRLGGLGVPVAALLVLIGGFLLRVVIIFSSEGMGVV